MSNWQAAEILVGFVALIAFFRRTAQVRLGSPIIHALYLSFSLHTSQARQKIIDAEE
jgi:hypothetical protein